MATKKPKIDLDTLIEERINNQIMSEREPFEPSKKVFCSNCLFWERSNYQESGSPIMGGCHWGPDIPSRRATDWCAKGIKDEG